MQTASTRDMSTKGDTFWCKNRQAEVTMLFCLDSFVDVNALNIKDSQCFKCNQGGRVRNGFSTP